MMLDVRRSACFDDVMHVDEDPSPEDIERFSRGEAYCPECGAELSDLADICPHCGAWLPRGPDRHHPEAAAMRRKMIIIITIATLIAFLGLYGLLRLF